MEGLRDGFFVSILPVPVPTCQSCCLAGDLPEWQSRLGNMAWAGEYRASEGVWVGLGVGLGVLTQGAAGDAGPVIEHTRIQTASTEQEPANCACLFDTQIMLHSMASLFSKTHSFCVALWDVP